MYVDGARLVAGVGCFARRVGVGMWEPRKHLLGQPCTHQRVGIEEIRTLGIVADAVALVGDVLLGGIQDVAVLVHQPRRCTHHHTSTCCNAICTVAFIRLRRSLHTLRAHSGRGRQSWSAVREIETFQRRSTFALAKLVPHAHERDAELVATAAVATIAPVPVPRRVLQALRHACVDNTGRASAR